MIEGYTFFYNWYNNKIILDKVKYLNLPPEKINIRSTFELNEKYKNVSGFCGGNYDEVYINPLLEEKLKESIIVHECSHALTEGDFLFSEEEKTLLTSPFKKEFKYSNYYLRPTEIHARINQARYFLNKSPQEEFTIIDLDKISYESFFYYLHKNTIDYSKLIYIFNKIY